MPELPEVETIKETLKLRILGEKIKDVEVFYSPIIKESSPEDFISTLKHQTLNDIKRKGKYMLFCFESNILVIHLRMEGKFFVKPEEMQKEKHEHVIFHFESGLTLRYHDVRKFGTMQIVGLHDELAARGIDKLGLEPFDPLFTLEYLKSRIHKAKRPIKSLLLDQTIVAGLGNIYVDEVLFLSKVHPNRHGSTLNDHEIMSIVINCKSVLKKAIGLGGTTIRSYLSSLGVSGRFQNELNVHTLVGKPCHVCNTPIEKIRVGGRGTYYCPNCQK
ncbi:MAG: DNA-formamidopyrimidine glycosylase [Bacilli bacterium]|nr:DNA-formamidopyrimidine glycosylase [Bacilli bacterium]MBN2696117.1 DNA-formamidopyrimidine glycosylase [Bacilli bacterium]